MTHKEEIRSQVMFHLMELDKLFEKYGSGSSLFLDTKFILEASNLSEFVKTVVRLSQ